MTRRLRSGNSSPFYLTWSPNFTQFFYDGRPVLYRIDTTLSSPRNSWAVVCFPPKVGSTAWKRQLIAGLDLHQLRAIFAANTSTLHNYRLPYLVPPHASNTVRNSRLWFMLVRHPVARLLSGFLDKATPNATDRKRVEGYELSFNFSNFVHAVTTTASRSLNPHFRLQSE